MRFNLFASRPGITREGAPAARISAEQELRRSLLSCFLWEDEFYENGQSIADRIMARAQEVSPEIIAQLAIEARSKHNLRHAPLLLLLALIKFAKGNLVSDTIAETIQRPDEITELLALYFKNGKQPLAKQLKLGLSKAFNKFDAYQLAKYNRDAPVKLRDALFLCHAKPKDEAQRIVFKQLADNCLPSPDTWEVALSAGHDKREVFTKLICEGKLGYLALLRNLRNMHEADVDMDLVKSAIIARKGAKRVLPFRFVAAARSAPVFEPWLDQALQESILESPILPGKTIILVDVSGSMDARLSRKSDLTRMDAAATLASIFPGDVRVFTFSQETVEVPPRRGMAGVDVIVNSQFHSSTLLGKALNKVNNLRHDRLIIITDEQSQDQLPKPKAKRAYMINVASNQYGVGYGDWVHIDGFSEAVLKFINEFENGESQK